MNFQRPFLFTSCLALAGTLYATPSNNITTLLNHIATNTGNTATTTSTTMTSALNKIAREQKYFSQAQSTFVYGNQTTNPTADYLNQHLHSTENTDDAANNALLQFSHTNIDQRFICSQKIYQTDTACLPKTSETVQTSVTIDSRNGFLLFGSDNYQQPQQVNTYINRLFKHAFKFARFTEIPHITLDTTVIGQFMEQRMPTGKNQLSFMAQLKQLVTTPTQKTWQQAMSKQSLSDRIQTLTQLVAVQNYLSFLRLQASQQRNVLLANASLERTQQAKVQAHILMQLRNQSQNQRIMMRRSEH